MMDRLLRAMSGLVPLVGRASCREVDRPVMGRGRARSYQVTPSRRSPSFSVWWAPVRGSTGPHERHSIGQEISGSQPRDGVQKPSSLEILSPAAKRRAVDTLKTTLSMSERLACKAVGLAGSTYRRLPSEGPGPADWCARWCRLRSRGGRFGRTLRLPHLRHGGVDMPEIVRYGLTGSGVDDKGGPASVLVEHTVRSDGSELRIELLVPSFPAEGAQDRTYQDGEFSKDVSADQIRIDAPLGRDPRSESRCSNHLVSPAGPAFTRGRAGADGNWCGGFHVCASGRRVQRSLPYPSKELSQRSSDRKGSVR